MRHNKSPLHKQLSFLDRLARFVRHPTTDWAATQIDPAQQRDALRAKQHKRERARMERAAAMIRNEEFDVLRRHMRNRKLQSPASLEGLTLPPTQPPARHVASQLHTLHKIAAIERQIQDEQKRQPVSRASDMVQHSGLAQIGFAASTLRPGSLRRATLPRWNFTQPQPNTDLPGADHSVLPTPAVIELAAFDFAELRDAQVESQLLTALQTEMHPPTAQQIFQSLLDFYWATRQNDKLQSRARLCAALRLHP